MQPTTSNNGINAIKEVKKLFNEIKSNLSRKDTKEIRKKLHKKETVYNFLKEKEQEGSLANNHKNILKKIDKCIKKKKIFRKNF